MFRPIAISLSPNMEKDDIFLAFRMLLSPRKWKDKKEVAKLESIFASRFGRKYKAIAVNSGRSAEYLILKALGVGKKDEVAIQAFTCVAVPNSIIWLKAKPVYIDIDETYNMSPRDLSNKIGFETKAIIVQHTFGIAANIEKIKKIAQNKNITLIEDCSHSMGATHKGKEVGSFGEVAFFSFGRDKALSSVFGGMILCSSESLYKKVKNERDKIKTPTCWWVAQQLFHPIAFAFILPLYNIYLGRVLLVFLQKIGFLSKAIYKNEKLTKRPDVFPAKMSGALAVLAINQIKKLERYTQHRREIANFYFSSLSNLDICLPPDNKGTSWLRFPIRHDKAKSLYNFAKKRGILLGDWYKDVVMPIKDLNLVDYKKGSCINAEKYARTVVNLPTYPALSNQEVSRVVKLIKQWLHTK